MTRSPAIPIAARRRHLRPQPDGITGRRGNHGSAVYYNDPKHRRVIVDGDQHYADDYLDRISHGDPDETGLLWRLAEHRARRLVEVRWNFIAKLAGELVSRRTLTEREVDEVLFSRWRGGES